MRFKVIRKRLNEISPGAYRQKLGNLIPEIVRVKLVSGNISSGVATIHLDAEGEICSVFVKSASGAVRVVTAFAYASGTATVTATSIAAGDTVTMIFI